MMEPASPPQKLVLLGALGQTIAFEDCDDVIAGMHDVFHGWDLQDVTGSPPPDAPCAATVSRTKNGWRWTDHGTYRPRDWDSHPPKSWVRVLTDIHEAALHWHLNANPDLLCIHGAAIQFGNSLMLLPARGRAGKSTLVAHLAALGQKVFGDDVLSLRSGQGLAMGFLPRLRTPLPQLVSDPMRQYVKSHAGPSGSGWLYLKPDKGKIAELGEFAPISSLILLRRETNAKADLSEARNADILQALVAENIIRTRPLLEIFDEMHEMASSHPKLWLTYSEPQQAAELLIKRFS